MPYSFNKALETIMEPMIESRRIKEFRKDVDSIEMKDFFNSGELNTLVDKLPNESAELYMANLILTGVVSRPSKGKRGPVQKVREFVSDEQRSHYDLYRKITELTQSFWDKLPEYKKLAGMEREVERTRNGKDEKVKLAIEPMVYHRDAKSVIDSYEVA